MTNLEITKPRTVGEWVAADYRTASIFREFGIDFCCGGKRTLAEVCRQKGIDLAALEQALSEPKSGGETPALPFNEWDLPFLIDYIVNVHHRYVLDKLPQIEQYADKVATVHGEAHPETRKIAGQWKAVSSELTAHLQKEERILFPYLTELCRVRDDKEAAAVPPFQTAANPIRVMEAEHDAAGELLHELRRLSDDFTPPDGACNTYRVLYALLAEFEADLHQHVHLENNLLFPKALALEQELFRKP